MKFLRAHPMTSDNRGLVPPNDEPLKNKLYYMKTRYVRARQRAEDGPCYLVRRGRRRPMAAHVERIALSVSFIPTAHPFRLNS